MGENAGDGIISPGRLSQQNSTQETTLHGSPGYTGATPPPASPGAYFTLNVSLEDLERASRKRCCIVVSVWNGSISDV